MMVVAVERSITPELSGCFPSRLTSDNNLTVEAAVFISPGSYIYIFHAPVVCTLDHRNPEAPYALDTLTLTLAALCHNVGHPGHNSSFIINSFHPLVRVL